MEVFNAELQLQSGEADVSRGLTALNLAQDYFESLAAQRGKILGSQVGTLAVTANSESTAFPAGVLRVDRLQLLDATTSLPVADLQPIRRVGGQAGSLGWPFNLTAQTGTENLAAYWTDGSNIYWAPIPSADASVRWSGFKTAVDITAAGTFAYPDIVRIPLASYAVRILKAGLDDDPTLQASMAQEAFTSVLDALGNFQRDGAAPLEYTRAHLA